MLNTLPSFGIINLAAACRQTLALGPGLRAAIWVQGCPFHCPGCLATEWIPQIENLKYSTDKLAEAICTIPDITGVTISGGEPMLQAQELANLLTLVKSKRDLDIICFTGYTLEQLRQDSPNSGVHRFLVLIDVLIDGPYVASKNNGRGLRGSVNQRFHFLTGRLRSYDFENMPRKVEIHLDINKAFIIGVPPEHFQDAFEQAVNHTQSQVGR